MSLTRNGVVLQIKRSEGQTAGLGPCFHLPGQAILEFLEPRPSRWHWFIPFTRETHLFFQQDTYVWCLLENKYPPRVPPINMEPFDVRGGPGLDHFPFKGTRFLSGSMLIGERVFLASSTAGDPQITCCVSTKDVLQLLCA